MSEVLYYIDDVRFEEEAYCEHCYDLEPFSPIVGEVDYCVECALMSGDLELNEKEKTAIRMTEKLLRGKHYRRVSDELAGELIIDYINADDEVLRIVEDIKKDQGDM